MQIDLERLRQHYSSLSDDELVALDREELTEAARKCYDDEVARRDLAEPEEPGEDPGEYTGIQSDHSVDPDWLQDAACACSYVSQPGGSAAGDAENARGALEDAGIPCQVSVVEIAASTTDQPAQHEYRVMVPGALNLKATAILDKEVFNPQLEADWRTHFETLTDKELGELNPDVICAGLVDRIARLKRVYNDEVSRRFRRSSE